MDALPLNHDAVAVPRDAHTVLVVDDEEPIRNALRRFLTQKGYPVLTAASGPPTALSGATCSTQAP